MFLNISLSVILSNHCSGLHGYLVNANLPSPKLYYYLPLHYGAKTSPPLSAAVPWLVLIEGEDVEKIPTGSVSCGYVQVIANASMVVTTFEDCD